MTGTSMRTTPEGRSGVIQIGHRNYVGGLWEQLGWLQYSLLITAGLKQDDYLLDIGCGALRGGIRFIPYLRSGHYLGLDKEECLLEIGIERELGYRSFASKRPCFVVSSTFEFAQFGRTPRFSIAQSLFTHLNFSDIHICLTALRRCVDEDHMFFATFNEGDDGNNPKISHSNKHFWYSRQQIESMARKSGWRAKYIGDWKHPRGQKLIRFEVQV